uniref:Glutathione peroxidase n=1 Tax=Lynx canadensis TaxID=61383 RepID=A0A667I4G3_LYNCA
MVGALVLAWLLLSAAACAQREQDFYDFKAVNIRGKLVSLEKYRGSVSLVVNVASECGFTDQHYRALQQLQRDLGPHHFNVLAFPCNQFGQQEPDSNKEIESFARRTYGVSFPMFSKVAVTGTGAHPAFKYLIQTSGKEPTWNFWKYLVAPDGKYWSSCGPVHSSSGSPGLHCHCLCALLPVHQLKAPHEVGPRIKLTAYRPQGGGAP